MAAGPSKDLNIIVAPETNKFNSPLPAQGSDTRKAFDTSRPPRFMDMTARNGVKRGADQLDEEDELDPTGMGQDAFGDDDDDDDDDELEQPAPKKKYSNKRNATSTGRRKIAISYIDDKAKRHVSFTKRKAGLMKKAYELSTLTGTNCLVLVVSETGLVYTYATPGLRPIIAHEDGKDVIARTLKGELTVDGAGPAGGSPDSASPEATRPRPPRQSSSRDTVTGQSKRKSSTTDFPQSTTAPEANSSSLVNSLPSLTAIAPPVNQHSANLFDAGPIDYLHGNLDALFAATTSASASTSLLSSVGMYASSSTAVPVTTTTTTTSTSTYPLMATYGATTSVNAPAHTAGLPELPPPGPRTAWERAAAEHAVAFQAYRNRTEKAQVVPQSPPNRLSGLAGALSSTHGAHEFSEAARKWQPPERSAVMNENWTIEERKNAARHEANMALREAFEKRTISSYIRAHKASHRASLPVPPRGEVDASPPTGIDATLEHFKSLCESGGIELPDLLGPAIESFLGDYLPNVQRHTFKMLNEARTHLMLFLDFLEGHELISAAKHDKLTAFFPTNVNMGSLSGNGSGSAGGSTVESPGAPNGTSILTHSPLDTLGGARKRYLTELFSSWANEAQHLCDAGQVRVLNHERAEGWFEAIKAKGNFVVVRYKDRSPGMRNAFKIRVGRKLVPEIRQGDCVWLSLRKVVSDEHEDQLDPTLSSRRDYWLPLQSGPVDVPPGPAMPDADPDMSMAVVNARRNAQMLENSESSKQLGSTSGADDQTRSASRPLQVARDSVAVLEVAKRMLDDGDVPE
ncbi:transcription factor of the MADS box [Microbotryomycetes sp. JL201]|nr:transcription factor of the MADS box [Microbotryomycetes sp. JL201]